MSDVYGNLVTVTSSGSTRHWRAWLNYSISSSNTQTTFTASCKLDLSGGSGTTAKFQANAVTAKLVIDGTAVKTFTNSSGVSVHADTDWTVISHSATWNRGTTAGAHSVQLKITSAKGSWGGTSITSSVSISVPALASYTVSFNGNGATSGSTAAQTKYYNINLALRSNGFSRTGYSFMGWGTSASATSASYANGATYSANAGITLYAIWRKTVTVSYNANGGSGAPAAQTGYMYNNASGVSITLSNTRPTKVGYNFRTWGTTTTGGTERNPGTTWSFSNSTTLYALWSLINYNLSYDYGGGTVATENPATYNTETSTFTLVEPTKDYYRFLGWTGTNGTTPQKNLSITTGSIGDRSYVANWERTYVAPTLVITECKRDNSEHSGDDAGVVPHVTFSWVAGTDERTPEDIISVVPTGYTITFRNQSSESSEPAHVYTHTYTSEEVDSETQSRIESVYCNEIDLNTESSYDVIVELILEDYDNITESDYISPAYFIIDINADGTAIGFGTAVRNDDDGFFSNLDIIAEKDFFFVLDDDAGPGSESETDYNIKQALIALGWLEEENN